MRVSQPNAFCWTLLKILNMYSLGLDGPLSDRFLGRIKDVAALTYRVRG